MPKNFSQKISDKDLLVLDVRTPGEYQSCFVKGSVLVPLDQLEAHRDELLRVNKPIWIVCKSGQRSKMALAQLEAMGVQDLHLFESGLSECESMGLSLEKSSGVWSLERQVRFGAGLLVFLFSLSGYFCDPRCLWGATFVGAGLMFAGVTDFCGMALVLAKMPWNQADLKGIEGVRLADWLKQA